MSVSIRIGGLARATGVSVQTLRYYERRGVIPAPRRTASGYREYGADAVEAVRFVAWMKSVGFTLREVRKLREILSEHTREEGAAAMRHRAEVKARAVGDKIHRLQQIQSELLALAACECDGERCPSAAAAFDKMLAPGGSPPHAP